MREIQEFRTTRTKFGLNTYGVLDTFLTNIYALYCQKSLSHWWIVIVYEQYTKNKWET